jgi:hypothetical protein
MRGHDPYLRSPDDIKRFDRNSQVFRGLSMTRNLRVRLDRMERQVNRMPSAKSIKEMTDAELLKCAGLPPDASDKDIAALVTGIEVDLGETARKEGTSWTLIVASKSWSGAWSGACPGPLSFQRPR